MHSANSVQYFIAFVHYFFNGTGLNFASTKTKKAMNTGTSMNYLALRQAIQGQFMIMGGAAPEEIENTEFRTIDGGPVYHISSARCMLGDLFTGTAKPKLYGTFYHPHLLIGMPSMGGDVKVYIDTRFEGHYVMTAAVKLDPWANGPSKWAIDAVCWTEKQPNDTIAKAGHRLIRSLIYHMDGLEDDKTTTSTFENESWQDEWIPSDSIKEAFIEVRGE
jgi:hypothetical protein